MHRRLLLLAVAALMVGGGHRTWAQDADQKLSPAQLDQILAPIALYPDALVAQTLMAATYPLEVVDAARWSKANPGLQGDAAGNRQLRSRQGLGQGRRNAPVRRVKCVGRRSDNRRFELPSPV